MDRVGVPNNVTRKWWVLAGVSSASFLGCIDLTIVNTAAPAIGAELPATLTQLQLIVNVFVVALSMFMVAAGRLSDLAGRRRTLYAGCALFGVASLGAGCAPNVGTLVACRFLQGAGCAVLYTSSSAIVSDAFEPARRGRAIGSLYAVNGLGLAIGPMLGGLLVGTVGWRWIFLINVPLLLVALAMLAVSLRESRVSGAVRLDLPGLALLAAALAGLIFAGTFGDAFGWASAPVLGAVGVGLAASVGFGWASRRTAHPVIPFRLFTQRLFRCAAISDFSLAFFYTTALFLLPLYLDVVRHADAVSTGLLMLPTTVTVAVLSPLTGRVVDRVGPIPVLLTGFVGFGLSALLQSRFDVETGLGVVLAAGTLMGIGWGCVLGPAAVAALSSVPKSDAGVALGAAWTCHNVGGAVGLAIGMTVYRRFAGELPGAGLPSPEAFIAGQHAATLLLAGGSTATLLALLVLSRSGRSGQQRNPATRPAESSDSRGGRGGCRGVGRLGPGR
jgi:EmrB/QacA subfamily drug resistance transporter